MRVILWGILAIFCVTSVFAAPSSVSPTLTHQTVTSSGISSTGSDLQKSLSDLIAKIPSPETYADIIKSFQDKIPDVSGSLATWFLLFLLFLKVVWILLVIGFSLILVRLFWGIVKLFGATEKAKSAIGKSMASMSDEQKKEALANVFSKLQWAWWNLEKTPFGKALQESILRWTWVLGPIKAKDPDFSEQGFKECVVSAFFAMEQALGTGDINPIRPYVSASIRIQFLFKQKDLQNKENKEFRDSTKLNEIQILSTGSDGIFDRIVVNLDISAKKYTKNASGKIISWSDVETISWSEKWIFTRPLGEITEITNHRKTPTKCANCGAGVGTISTSCQYCGAEYATLSSWLVSEISG